MGGLLILGAGGHGRVVAEIATLSKRWEKIVFLDDHEDINEIEGISVKGKLDDSLSLINKYRYAFVAIGNNKLRLHWLNQLSNIGYILPTLVHPSSSVSLNSELGEGTVVMAGSIINPGARIGKGCIINTSSSIDHDCILQDGVHVSPGSHIGGTVNIGQCSWVCIGANIANNITIGSNVVVAAGATIIQNVTDNVMVAGIPGTIKKKVMGEMV